MKSKKKKPDVSKSRKLANVCFFLNILLLASMWIVTQFYTIPPMDILLSWLFITILMIVILWFTDRRAARMVLDDLSPSP